jgi:hypothetical protein
VLLCFSCDYFSFEKNKNEDKLDMNIDYSSVDSSPSFKVCDSIIDKAKKTICFRTTIREEISKSLAKYSIKVKKPVDETIVVTITIQSNKQVKLSKLEASDSLLPEISDLKEMIEKSIDELPEIYPAIKRSIPVTTEYKLPIRIKL